jgi:hypothetical protein
VFPGRADGGLTERVGFTLSRDFIAHADLMVGLKTRVAPSFARIAPPSAVI